MKNRTIFILAAVFIFAMSIIAGYFGLPAYQEYVYEKRRVAFVPPGVPKSRVEAFAADFQFLSAATEPLSLPDHSFIDHKGNKVRFDLFDGRPLLINFWATWCAPCVVELPSLEKLKNHYDGRLQVIAIALEPDKKPADITTFLANRNIGDFAGYLDQNGEFMKSLSLTGIPASFLVGSDGLILYRFDGDADWTSPQSLEFFDIFLMQNR